MSLPLGMRLNNPGNLRPGKKPWRGQTGVSESGFCIFATLADGLRACALQILIDFDRHALHSIKAVVERWAPQSENDTAAYIAAVAARTGWDAHAMLNLHDLSVLSTFAEAITHQEQGQASPPMSQITDACEVALRDWLAGDV